MRRGAFGILNFGVAGFILIEVFIQVIKNAQTLSGIEVLTLMLWGALGFSQIGMGIWVFLEYRHDKPKEKQNP